MKISINDIISNEDYASERKTRRLKVIEIKKYRRIDVGPVVSMYFENRETMIYQIQEMALTEKIAKDDLHKEMKAYNPLVPDGKELVATMMIEIDDSIRRKSFLSRLGGIETKVKFFIGEIEINAEAEEDIDRTTADGKASSVHFLHFKFTKELIEKFKSPNVMIKIGIEHEYYGHIAMLNKSNIEALSMDFN